VGTEGRYNLFGSTLNANKCVLICGWRNDCMIYKENINRNYD
jgi:hypothetical protein